MSDNGNKHRWGDQGQVIIVVKVKVTVTDDVSQTVTWGRRPGTRTGIELRLATWKNRL